MSRRLATGVVAAAVATLPGATAAAAPPPVSVEIGDQGSVTLQPLPQVPPTRVEVPPLPRVPKLVPPVTERLHPRTGSPYQPAPQPVGSAAPPRAEGALPAPVATRSPARSGAPGSAGRRASRARARTPSRQSAGRRLVRPTSPAASSPEPPGAKPRVEKAKAGILSMVVGVLPRWVRVALGLLGFLALVFAATWLVNQLRAWRLHRQSRHLVRDATLLKQTLLTEPGRRVGPLLCSIASEGTGDAGAGQAFYDVFALGRNRAGILIGQVSGGEPTPLAQAALMRHRLRAHLELGLPPRAVLRRADELRRSDPDGGVTAATVAIYDGAGGSLTYSCAGQPTPLVFSTAPDAPAPVAGFTPPMGAGVDCDRRQTTISLPPDSTACIFSDGVRWQPAEGDAIERDALSEVAGLADPAADVVLSRLRDGPRPGSLIVCLVRAAVAAVIEPTHVEELVLTPEEAEAAHHFLIACGLAPREAAVLAGNAAERAEQTGHSLLRVSWAVDGPATQVVTYRPEAEWPTRAATAVSHA